MRIVLDWSKASVLPEQMQPETRQEWQHSIQQLQAQHEVLVLLEGTHPHQAMRHRLFLQTCVAAEAIHVWFAPPASDDSVAQSAAMLLHQHAVQALKADWVHEVVLTATGQPPIWAQTLPSLPAVHEASASSASKPTLVMVSPLLPTRTGVANYTSRLLPLLSHYYDIVVVPDQETLTDPWVLAHAQVKDSAWLLEHGHTVDRVVYQMGNSAMHAYIWPLMRAIPGVVVLHDFYLGGWVEGYERDHGPAGLWEKHLYESHGYAALRYLRDHEADATYRYPANFDCIRFARGLISHSLYSKQLTQHWYGAQAAQHWAVIPLLCKDYTLPSREVAREQLGLVEDDFLVCSFGFLGKTKLNHRLLASWLSSDLAHDPRCHLVFVGENNPETYGQALVDTIQHSGQTKHITITGFASHQQYQNYLAAADVVVQLRSLSRGESSATVLDGMAAGLAVIMNANGAFAEINQDAVWMLPDAFSDEQLVQALHTLHEDAARRQQLGQRALAEVQHVHHPQQCAQRYYDAIEQFYAVPHGYDVAHAVGSVLAPQATAFHFRQLARAIAATYPTPVPQKRLFIDMTATLHHDLRTGIERVVRALSVALLNESLAQGEFYLEPVYLAEDDGHWQYRYARRHTLPQVDAHRSYPLLHDEVVEFGAGDTLLGLDLSGHFMQQADQDGLFQRLQLQGVTVYWMLYDLLPIQIPEVFPPGADQQHEQWLERIATFDGVIAISKTVADAFAEWRAQQTHLALKPTYLIQWAHLGADIVNSDPSQGMPPQAEHLLQKIRSKPTFLMVGTIEPRKGHVQVLEAMTLLWRKGVDVNLVVVGREGWRGLEPNARRTIPQAIYGLSQLKRNLYWFNDASDEFVEQLYQSSSALIAASFGEGFGLPLIEAAQHQLSIIARDLPVFREVAGDHAFFFHADTAQQLAEALIQWLEQRTPTSADMPWQTWQQMAKQVVAHLGFTAS
ncbi:glycosyltransferase [Paenalcaligenes hominis]|uniref:glycosyltransferase n=1 Tax=Paenalcaligenes hominis TaxID=643674 RepID=UPI0035255A97